MVDISFVAFCQEITSGFLHSWVHTQFLSTCLHMAMFQLIIIRLARQSIPSIKRHQRQHPIRVWLGMWLFYLTICEKDWKVFTSTKTIPYFTAHHWIQLFSIFSTTHCPSFLCSERFWSHFAQHSHSSSSFSTSKTVSNIGSTIYLFLFLSFTHWNLN